MFLSLRKKWDDEAVMAKKFLSPFRHNRPFFEKVTSYSSPDNRTASSFYRAKRLNRLKCLKSEYGEYGKGKADDDRAEEFEKALPVAREKFTWYILSVHS